MHCKVIYLSTKSVLVCIKRCYYVEGIDSSLRSRTDVNKTSTKILGKIAIFVLGVEDEYLGIFRREIGENGFCRKGFTRTGLTYDNHIGVYALSVALEEIYDNREISTRSENRTTVIHYGREHEWEYRRNRSGVNCSCKFRASVVSRDVR